MKLEPVNINIKNLRKFAAVSLILDQKGFVELINYIRHEELEGRTYERELIESEFRVNELIDNGNDELRKDIATASGWTEEIIDHNKLYYEDYYYPFFYAIICNEVREKDIEMKPKLYLADKSGSISIHYVNPPEAAIYITPFVTKAQLLKLFSYYSDKFAQLKEITNIERDRKWYWMKYRGLSYGKIQKLAKEEGETITRDGVIKAIDTYRRRLENRSVENYIKPKPLQKKSTR